jgi:heavy metal translocating P-type ATPase
MGFERTSGPRPVNEWIAMGTLVALGVWAVMALGGHGATPLGWAWRLPDWVVDTEAWSAPTGADLPLLAALVIGGAVLVWGLARKLVAGTFGSDLLAGIAIVTSLLLGEYLAGALVVLMLSGGEALESRAVARAGDVLHALARRMPTRARRRRGRELDDVPLDRLNVGDLVVVPPHEICPVDGTVVVGRGSMDESYLTGEPYRIGKAAGSPVLAGAINGAEALEVRVDRVVGDSRYARIMDVLRSSEQRRPRLRRLAETLGALYTPLAVAVAVGAWLVSGSPTRFLAVLVVATPCPLLIAIPVAIIGAVSLAAKRGIVVRDPAVLERLDRCRTAIFDKTGTLTYGAPRLTEVVPVGQPVDVDPLALAASLERYSKHPLAAAVVAAAADRGLILGDVERVAEEPGRGLVGRVADETTGFKQVHEVAVVGRRSLAANEAAALPAAAGGLECVVIVDHRPAALLRFRDAPREGGMSFVRHLGPAHGLSRVMLVSGDRESEVRWLAEAVGIEEIHAEVSPEGKLRLVEAATAEAPTVFVGDGINDAPALAAATVGIAMGAASDVTGEAAGAVVMDTALEKIDELFHIARRLRSIALQSAVGGMAASMVGMGFAAAGWLPPAAGALVQEAIDVLAVANALRVSWRPGVLTDFAASRARERHGRGVSGFATPKPLDPSSRS